MGWQAVEAQIDGALLRAVRGAAKAPLLPGALIEQTFAPHAALGSTALWSVPLGLGATAAGAVGAGVALSPEDRSPRLGSARRYPPVVVERALRLLR